jgi:phage terminase large subunit
MQQKTPDQYPPMLLTQIWERNRMAYHEGKRLIINRGGTSSSKTFSIMQLLVIIACTTATQLLISVVSESMPHLKRGCVRDFQAIMAGNFETARWNKTDHIYRFDKATIEFFPADEASKMRGGRRDILFINECNNVVRDAYNELSVRTKKTIFLDYNPVSEFWLHEMGLEARPDAEYIHSTYLDTMIKGVSILPVKQVADIESRRGRDPNWWRVYGLGELGNIEGLVHPVFHTVETLPEGGASFYGLDFGYTNDPTALVRCCLKGDELYTDQLLYETGLNNQQIARRLADVGVRKGYDEIFADAAEPKSIDEIKLHGWNIKPAPKGPDSVRQGIDRVNQYRQFWTKRSVDAIKEMRNYRYVEDKDGKLTNKPVDCWNHALDARRYAVQSKIVLTGSMRIEYF